jgi:hypothetical protein
MSERPAQAVAGPEEGAAQAGVPAGPLPRRSRLRSYVVAEALAIALGYAVTTLQDGPPATQGAAGRLTTRLFDRL